MVCSWIKNQRRSQLLWSRSERWCTYLLDNVALRASRLAAGNVQQSYGLVARTSVSGAGLSVTDEMKVTVAGQAAILVLGLEKPVLLRRRAVHHPLSRPVQTPGPTPGLLRDHPCRRSPFRRNLVSHAVSAAAGC